MNIFFEEFICEVSTYFVIIVKNRYFRGFKKRSPLIYLTEGFLKNLVLY